MKKQYYTVALLVGLSLSGLSALAAETYPTRPITLVLGFPPGGGADHVARVYADGLSKKIGQAVIVENRPGAGATIAATHVSRAKPDGYTIFLGNSSVMGSDNVLYKVSYTPDSFAPIIQLTTGPMILIASEKSGIKSVQDLIQRAKEKPGAVTFSSSGNGVITHLAAVEFMQNQGVEMLHVPYSGGAPATQAVAAGDVDVSFATAPSARPVIDSGRALGLGLTSRTPSSALPQFAPLAAQGAEGYNMVNWWGIFAPAGTPEKVQDIIFKMSQAVLQEPSVITTMRSGYEDVTPSESIAAFVEFAKKEGALGLHLAEISRKSVN